MPTRKLRIIFVNALLTVVGIALVLGIWEWRLRTSHKAYDTFKAAAEKPWFRANPNDLTKVFTIDPEFGFRPILGGAMYSDFGTLHNDYALEKPDGKTRLLFIGDSVTRIGFIVDALRDIYGDEKFEYWNAGVDSFSTVQEANFYRRFNSAIKPDHVILTFHNNDFETTPVVFLSDHGKMVLFSPYMPRGNVNGWLLRKSHLYRRVLGSLIEKNRKRYADQIVEEVRNSLESLSRELEASGIKFSVLIHPVLLPTDKWKHSEVANYSNAVEIAEGLNLRYFDLTPPLLKALEAGIDPRWDQWKNDKAHPSKEAAGYFARYLFDNGLL